jgi:hypothetical protein
LRVERAHQRRLCKSYALGIGRVVEIDTSGGPGFGFEYFKQLDFEKGFSAVRLAFGVAPAPFFRFPQLQHPPAMVIYLGTRDIAMFSTDLDSFDFKAGKPEKIVETVMTKVNKLGKGIILMHDFQKHTAEALPALLAQLKAGGYKVVQMKAKAPVATLAEYDAEVVKDAKLPTISARPVSSVEQTVN